MNYSTTFRGHIVCLICLEYDNASDSGSAVSSGVVGCCEDHVGLSVCAGVHSLTAIS